MYSEKYGDKLLNKKAVVKKERREFKFKAEVESAKMLRERIQKTWHNP